MKNGGIKVMMYILTAIHIPVHCTSIVFNDHTMLNGSTLITEDFLFNCIYVPVIDPTFPPLGPPYCPLPSGRHYHAGPSGLYLDSAGGE